MSGASETYALFAFPPQIPMPFYIQVSLGTSGLLPIF
jgi:hypothetical protein